MIGQAIAHNAGAVINLKDTTARLDHLHKEYHALVEKVKEIGNEKISLERSLEELQNMLQERENKLEKLEDQYESEIGSATELVEKQNALTMTLEAKVWQCTY